MSTRRVHRLAVPVSGAALLTVLGAGLAFAYYGSNVSTSGTGRATPIATSTVTLTVTGTVSTNLYPGGAGASVTISVANPYSRPLAITGIAATGSVTVTPVPGRTCANTGITVNAPTSGLPVSVPASTTVSNVTLPGTVKMGTGADNGCQGATFQIPFQVTGQL